MCGFLVSLVLACIAPLYKGWLFLAATLKWKLSTTYVTSLLFPYEAML